MPAVQPAIPGRFLRINSSTLLVCLLSARVARDNGISFRAM
jgi:hypothetical protein